MPRSNFWTVIAVALFTCAQGLNAAVILSESFDGADGTQPTGFIAQSSAGMVSQNDGSGEYEQARVSGNGFALGAYQVFDDIDQGIWRDVTVETNTRYSGGDDNDNGLIVRARDLNGSGGGEFYMVRFQDDDAIRLYRVNGGTFTPLQTVSVPALGGTNRKLSVDIANIATPGTDHVRIQATLFASDGVTVQGSIDYTDTSANAITRAGGVGYRSFNNSNAVTRATFDDLLVTSTNPGLLFYDDYADDEAIRMQSFGPSGSVSGNKFEFSHGGSSSTSLGLVDFDSATPAWKNVEATSVMRLNTNGNNSSQIATGLVLRETGVASNVSGEAGDFYLYRLVRNESGNSFAAQLLRKNGTSGFSFLDSVALGDLQIPESVNIFMKFSAVTEGSTVRLVGMASLDQDFAASYGLIDFVDNSPDAILGGGSAGFRHFGIGTSNYDNFTVRIIPSPSAVAVGAFGALALGARRRRRRVN